MWQHEEFSLHRNFHCNFDFSSRNVRIPFGGIIILYSSSLRYINPWSFSLEICTLNVRIFSWLVIVFAYVS